MHRIQIMESDSVWCAAVRGKGAAEAPAPHTSSDQRPLPPPPPPGLQRDDQRPQQPQLQPPEQPLPRNLQMQTLLQRQERALAQLRDLE